MLVFAINADAHDRLTERCGYTAYQLQSGLLGNLKNYADEFIEAEQQHGVNAVFLASIAALESGWGESTLTVTKNNFYGWTGNSGFIHFDSPQECINHVAAFLSNHYLSSGGKYHQGNSVAGVCVHYNGKDEWTTEVCGLMDEIIYRTEQFIAHKERMRPYMKPDFGNALKAAQQPEVPKLIFNLDKPTFNVLED